MLNGLTSLLKSKQKKAEEKALAEHNHSAPAMRRTTMSEREQRQAVFEELKRHGYNHLCLKDVKRVQDALEEVLRRELPRRNVRVYGLGTFRLEFKRSQKYNLDPNKILGAGYAPRFDYSETILRECDLRKAVPIMEDEI